MYMYSFPVYVIWFMIYSFIGWIYESTLRSITHRKLYNSGFLNGPYIPIYGFGAVFDIFLLSDLKNPFFLFLAAAIINCALEYFTSWFMEILFHARWWDYSNKPFNIHGRIYLTGFIAFGLFAVVVILYFHPWLILHTTNKMSEKTINLLSGIIATLILSDTYITVSSLQNFEAKMQEFISTLHETELEVKEKVENLPYADKIALLREHFNFQERRLLDAFPNLHFHDVKYTAIEIKSMVVEHTKELFGQ